MKRNDQWTAEWISERIKHDKITSVDPIGTNWVRVGLLERAEPVVAATISMAAVRAGDLQEVYTAPNIEFIINVKKEALYRQDALEMSELLAFGLGGLSDFYVAANEDSFSNYISKEFRFILRGLKQHTSVKNVIRINNRLLKIERWAGDNLMVLALNEYDLTAEAVRDGFEKFGQPEIVLTSNPNCRASDESIRAAETGGAQVLRWGELMSALNR